MPIILSSIIFTFCAIIHLYYIMCALLQIICLILPLLCLTELHPPFISQTLRDGTPQVQKQLCLICTFMLIV